MEEVIDRPDWSAGNHLGVVLDGSATLVPAWRCFGNVQSGSPPRLEVEHLVLPPSGGACPLACGFETFGHAASPANDLGLVGTGSPAIGGVATFLTTGVPIGPGPVYSFLGTQSTSLPFYGGTLLVSPVGLLGVLMVHLEKLLWFVANVARHRFLPTHCGEPPYRAGRHEVRGVKTHEPAGLFHPAEFFLRLSRSDGAGAAIGPALRQL